ncbi:MAG: dipeptide epimerase [Pseudomonadota bacterium]
MTFGWKAEPVSYAIDGEFRISRGAKTQVNAIRVTIESGGAVGVGEAVPYSRFNETIEGSIDDIRRALNAISEIPTRQDLLQTMRPTAARNALDAALWDLECKRAGISIGDLLPDITITPRTTAYTISADTPEKMHEHALRVRQYPLLKLKAIGEDDSARLSAVRDARPDAQIILDANEAWDESSFQVIAPLLRSLGVVVLEQPAPAGQDAFLSPIEGVHICADESITDMTSISKLSDAYTMINIKLDKTGGLTHALEMIEYAKRRDLKIMVGCMLGASLSMAPAFIAAQFADYVDLDGPLLLKEDNEHPIAYQGAQMQPPSPLLWG